MAFLFGWRWLAESNQWTSPNCHSNFSCHGVWQIVCINQLRRWYWQNGSGALTTAITFPHWFFGSIYVVVQFSPWLKFSKTHYHRLPYYMENYILSEKGRWNLAINWMLYMTTVWRHLRYTILSAILKTTLVNSASYWRFFATKSSLFLVCVKDPLPSPFFPEGRGSVHRLRCFQLCRIVIPFIGELLRVLCGKVLKAELHKGYHYIKMGKIAMNLHHLGFVLHLV